VARIWIRGIAANPNIVLPTEASFDRKRGKEFHTPELPILFMVCQAPWPFFTSKPAFISHQSFFLITDG